MAWPTAKEIVNDAGVLVGLLDDDLDDPFASDDQAVRQLCRLLKVTGREVAKKPWTHLTREATIVTVAGQKAYPLPAGYRTMIPQTGWNRSRTEPLGGPLSPQQWQAAKGSRTTFTGWVLFRPANGELWLLEDALSGGATLAFEYRTSWWAGATGDTAPTKEWPSASMDVVFLDAHLMTQGLVLEWKKAHGLDTTSSQQDFDAALSDALDADAPGKVLRLGRRADPHFLDESNLPDTGWGR